MKAGEDRGIKGKTNTLTMLWVCFFPVMTRMKLFMCVVFFPSTRAQTDGYQTIIQMPDVHRKTNSEGRKKRELCSLEALCDSEASLCFCLLSLFLSVFLSGVWGRVSRGPPGASERGGCIPRSVPSVCAVCPQRKSFHRSVCFTVNKLETVLVLEAGLETSTT